MSAHVHGTTLLQLTRLLGVTLGQWELVETGYCGIGSAIRTGWSSQWIHVHEHVLLTAIHGCGVAGAGGRKGVGVKGGHAISTTLYSLQGVLSELFPGPHVHGTRNEAHDQCQSQGTGGCPEYRWSLVRSQSRGGCIWGETLETDLVPLEGHVRVVEVGTALDDEADAHRHLLGHIARARQVDGEVFEGDGHVALEWDVQVGRK